MTKTPIIGVLETGRPPEELMPDHGDYLAMVASWIGETAAEYKVFAALDGVLPDTPSEADLWVITGSKFGTYEALGWILPLEEFIRACRIAGRPMMGICFGHQIIAQALGGVVRKSAKGWGLGIHDYAPVNWPEALGPAPENIAIQAFHQDQVEELPEGAERIACSAFCENAALWYPGFAFTVQGHPEFANPYAHALLEFRKGTVLDPGAVAAAQAGMDRGNTRADLARLIRDRLLR